MCKNALFLEQVASFLRYLHKQWTLQLNDVHIYLNKLACYLLQTLTCPWEFLSQLSIDFFCLKDAHVTVKSHMAVKFGYGQVKVPICLQKHQI